MIPALDLGDAIAVVSGIVTLTVFFLGQRYNTERLKVTLQAGQNELLRQVQAVHKRLDDYGRRLTRAERDHAVLEERVENLRDTKRFKLRDDSILKGVDE